MDELKSKYKNLIEALNSIDEALDNLSRLELKKDKTELFLEYNRLYRSFHDSLIRRFKITVGLFGKYLKRYLEQKGVPTQEVNSPKTTLRTACRLGLITEKDTEVFIKMLDSRNLTSHTYKEEFAGILCQEILKYFELMNSYAKKLDII